jgi:carbon-monoxide dehydrogenase large subunit
MERLIDRAARQCGFDRLELRRRNLVPETAMPYTKPVRHDLRQRRIP